MPEEPSIVPDKLDTKIDFRIIIAILGGVILTHFVINYGIDDPDDHIVSLVSIINPLSAGIIGIIVSHRYASGKVFQRAYLALGIGYLANSAGEFLYYTYDVIFNEIPFPSIADGFFLSFYPLIITHLILNIRFFAPKKPKITTLSWIVTIPLAITFSFVVIYGTDNIDVEFVVSMAYIVFTTSSLSLTIYGTSIFRQGLIGKAWLILLFGVLATTFADVWYFYLEAFEEYSLEHPINIFWYAGYWIVFYALYKHRQSI